MGAGAGRSRLTPTISSFKLRLSMSSFWQLVIGPNASGKYIYIGPRKQNCPSRFYLIKLNGKDSWFVIPQVHHPWPAMSGACPSLDASNNCRDPDISRHHGEKQGIFASSFQSLSVLFLAPRVQLHVLGLYHSVRHFETRCKRDSEDAPTTSTSSRPRAQSTFCIPLINDASLVGQGLTRIVSVMRQEDLYSRRMNVKTQLGVRVIMCV